MSIEMKEAAQRARRPRTRPRPPRNSTSVTTTADGRGRGMPSCSMIAATLLNPRTKSFCHPCARKTTPTTTRRKARPNLCKDDEPLAAMVPPSYIDLPASLRTPGQEFKRGISISARFIAGGQAESALPGGLHRVSVATRRQLAPGRLPRAGYRSNRETPRDDEGIRLAAG